MHLEHHLLEIATQRALKDDVSHDIHHLQRVLGLAKRIAESEGADMDVVIPAALFHDIVVYPKYDPRSEHESEESAQMIEAILAGIPEYPKEKIPMVGLAIRECSFGKGITPELLESRVLQDADRLEATGAVAIMRAFSSGGKWDRIFYHPVDPFCVDREPDAHKFTVDLFYKRLLVVGSLMTTTLGKELAKRRTEFLYAFLDEFALELEESTREESL